MVELTFDQRRGLRVSREMGRLARDFEVTATRKGTSDPLFLHNLLDEVDGFEGRGVHTLGCFASVASDQRRHRQFQSRQYHAAIAATGTPSEFLGFEYRGTDTPLGQHTCRREPTKTSAHYRDVDKVGQPFAGPQSPVGYRF